MSQSSTNETNSCLVLGRKLGARLQVGLQIGRLLEEAVNVLYQPRSHSCKAWKFSFALAGTHKVVIEELEHLEVSYGELIAYEVLSSMVVIPLL
jgi:hypothetical protein